MDQNADNANQQTNAEGVGGTPTPPDAAAKKPDAAAKVKLPKKLIMQSLYAFYDDAGRLWSWVEGQIVDEVDHIKMLIERKAPAVEHKED